MHIRLLTGLLLLSACTSTPHEDSIVGTWIMDREATLALDEYHGQPPESLQQVSEELESMKLEMRFTETTFTFRMNVFNGVATQKSDYRISARNGERFILVLSKPEGEEEVPCILRGNHLTFLDDSTKVVLKRL